ncbi:MAG TPA: glycosyltransferase, partial [Anaerolineae bacterium]|nr:glycosyltransferase [Anaerolineae bacterium]
ACPDAHFVIAGRGESLARYRRMMVHPERFEVRDEYIPRADVPRLFQEAALVALPYVEASQSAVVPLAYAFGKPVVASAVGGLPEMVEDGQDGLLVPPRDSDRLAAAIVALLRDDERRRRMQAHIRLKVAGELSWDSIARSTLRVYEESRGEGEG